MKEKNIAENYNERGYITIMRKLDTLGMRLRHIRKLNDLTQFEMSVYLDVDVSSVGKYERDERRPSYETINLISDRFNISLDYLLKGKVK